MDTAAIGVAQKEDAEQGVDEQDILVVSLNSRNEVLSAESRKIRGSQRT